jgi:hypothetical protein
MRTAEVRRFRWVTPLAIAAALASVPAWAAAPVVTFEEQAVVASGVTPGGSVAVFGVSREFNGFAGYFLRHDRVLADDDGDGAVRLELELPVSPRTVAAAVDLGTGEVGFGAPAGFELQAGALPADAIGADRGELTAAGRRVYALWVRPAAGSNAGVWGANAGDGGASDGDGAEDGSVRTPVSAFVPIEPDGAAPPERLAAGDVLITVDPESLQVATLRLSE